MKQLSIKIFDKDAGTHRLIMNVVYLPIQS